MAKRFDYGNYVSQGSFSLDTLEDNFPKITKKRRKYIDELVVETTQPRAASYVGAELEDPDNLPESVRLVRLNQGRGRLGEELALLIIEYHESLTIEEKIILGVDTFERNQKQSERSEGFGEKYEQFKQLQQELGLFRNYTTNNSYTSKAALVALLAPPDRVSWSFNYENDFQRIDQFASLENFCRIWYDGFFRFELQEGLEIFDPFDQDLIEHAEWRTNSPGLIYTPPANSYNIIKEWLSIKYPEYSLKPITDHSWYRDHEVQQAHGVLTSLHSNYAYRLLDEENYEKYQQYNNAVNLQARLEYFKNKIQSREFNEILNRYWESVYIFAFDFMFVVKRKGKPLQEMYALEVKSGAITCDQHASRGPFALSKNQRYAFREIITCGMMDEYPDQISLRVLKLNFCECGLIFYYLIEPRLK